MAIITLEKAKEKLKSATKEEIIHILEHEVDITSPGSKTVLYSGMDEATLETLKADSSIRMIDKTDAAKLITSTEFNDALKRIFGKADSSEAIEFLHSTKEGSAWNTVSKRFAKATEGEVILFVGKRDDRNNTVKPINNIIFKKEEAASWQS